MILSPPITGDAVLDAWTFKLANELNTVILPAIASGALGSGGASSSSGGNGNTLLRLYQRTTSSTSPSNPTTCTFDISDLDNTSISANNSWLDSIPALASGNYLWVTSRYVSTTTGTITDANTWDTPAVLSFSGSGATGLNQIDVVISSPTVSVPADNNGTVTDNSDTGCTIRVFDGSSEQNFFQFIPNQSTYIAPGRWVLTQATSGVSAGSETDSGNHATIGTLVNFSGATATQTFTISGKRTNQQTYTRTITRTLSKAIAGPTGVVGDDGDTTKTLFLYDSSVNAPTTPTTSQGFTASTGAPANIGTWTTAVPTIGSGEGLWIATAVLTQTQSSGSFTTTGWSVYRASGYDGSAGATGGTGGTGAAGPRFATRRLYRAGVSAPSAPSAFLTWGTGALSGITSGWSITPPLQVATSTTNVWFSDLFFVDTSLDHSSTGYTETGSTPAKSISFSGLVTFNSGDFALDGSTITSIDGGNITAGSLNVTNAEITNLAVSRLKIADFAVSDQAVAIGGALTMNQASHYSSMHSLTLPVVSGVPIRVSAGILYREDLYNSLASDGSEMFTVRLNIKLTHLWTYPQIRENVYSRETGYYKNGSNYVMLEDIFTPNVTGNVTVILQAQSFAQNKSTGAQIAMNIYRYRSYFSIHSVVK
jgi:hypothetical protein